MTDLELECVNHPGRTTRVRCSSCGNPICTSCMRETPVGMKCPDCARQPLRVRYGNPRRYFAAAGAGLAAAVVAGALLASIRLGILFSILAGLAVGEVFYRASGRQSMPAFQAVAIVITVAGLSLGALLTGVPTQALVSGRWLLAVGIAALFAVLRIR